MFEKNTEKVKLIIGLLYTDKINLLNLYKHLEKLFGKIDYKSESFLFEYTEYYKNAPTKAIGLMKKMLNKSGNSTLDEMLEYEKQCQEIAGSSSDYKEGVTAFLEKRKAAFTGK